MRNNLNISKGERKIFNLDYFSSLDFVSLQYGELESYPNVHEYEKINIVIKTNDNIFFDGSFFDLMAYCIFLEDLRADREKQILTGYSYFRGSKLKDGTAVLTLSSYFSLPKTLLNVQVVISNYGKLDIFHYLFFNRRDSLNIDCDALVVKVLNTGSYSETGILPLLCSQYVGIWNNVETNYQITTTASYQRFTSFYDISCDGFLFPFPVNCPRILSLNSGYNAEAPRFISFFVNLKPELVDFSFYLKEEPISDDNKLIYKLLTLK